MTASNHALKGVQLWLPNTWSWKIMEFASKSTASIKNITVPQKRRVYYVYIYIYNYIKLKTKDLLPCGNQTWPWKITDSYMMFPWTAHQVQGVSNGHRGIPRTSWLRSWLGNERSVLWPSCRPSCAGIHLEKIVQKQGCVAWQKWCAVIGFAIFCHMWMIWVEQRKFKKATNLKNLGMLQSRAIRVLQGLPLGCHEAKMGPNLELPPLKHNRTQGKGR